RLVVVRCDLGAGRARRRVAIYASARAARVEDRAVSRDGLARDADLCAVVGAPGCRRHHAAAGRWCGLHAGRAVSPVEEAALPQRALACVRIDRQRAALLRGAALRAADGGVIASLSLAGDSMLVIPAKAGPSNLGVRQPCLFPRRPTARGSFLSGKVTKAIGAGRDGLADIVSARLPSDVHRTAAAPNS